MTDIGPMKEEGENVEWRRRFEQITPRPLYKEVAAQIRDSICQGDIPSGEPLPTERHLGEVFGVSRSSIREAIRVLEAEGWVVEDGSARRVVALDEFGPLKVALLDYAQLQQAGLDDLIEFRGILESSAVELASKRSIGSYLSDAQQILERMADEGITPTEFDELNTRFHLAVVASSGNEVIVRVMRLLREALSGYLPDLLARAVDPQETLTRMVHEHRELLAAIGEGNANRAALLARSHVEGAYGLVENESENDGSHNIRDAET